MSIVLLEKRYQEALNFIEQSKVSEDPEIKIITNHLLTTTDNPYSFLPKDYGGSTYSVESFQFLLNKIQENLLSGNISFPIVKNKPCIAFVQQGVEDYYQKILTETHIKTVKNFLEMMDKKFDLNDYFGNSQCDNLYDFVKKQQELGKPIKELLVEDIQKYGRKIALDKYKTYREFDPTWNWGVKTDEQLIKKIQKEISRNDKNKSLLPIEEMVKNHREAIDFIKKTQETGSLEMMSITNYLLSSLEKDLIYDFIPKNWYETSTGLKSLLHSIDHALFDDGDVCFPIIDGKPYIYFQCIEDDCIQDYNGNKVKVEEYCSNIFDFIKCHKKIQNTVQLKNKLKL